MATTALAPEDIDDLVALTLSTFKKKKWTDLSLEYTEYFASALINEKSVVEDGGKDIEWKVKTKNAGTARNSGTFATDHTQVEDVMVTANAPWRKQDVSWSYDIDEDCFQQGKTQIISTVKIREHQALSSLAELQEENLWSAPTGPTDKRPWGIPYWLQKDANTTPDGALNGKNPAGFPGGCAGISSEDYSRWANWTFGYKAVTKTDLIRKIKKALYETTFQHPVPHPTLGFGKSSAYCMYSTYNVREPLETLAESRNDNLGSDVAKYIDSVTVGGVPLKSVPYLDANDSSHPIYGVNWNVMRPYTKKGCNMRRTKPMQSPKQHSVRDCFIDHWMNWFCYDRRKTFVGSLQTGASLG